MIFKNAIESLEETPLIIQKKLTEISELKQKNVHYQEIVDNIPNMITNKDGLLSDEDLNTVNHASLKLYDCQQSILDKYNQMLSSLDEQINEFEKELAEYKEGCAISALKLRAHGIDVAFDDASVIEKYCYCKKECRGNMVACDGDLCPIEWFHYECVGLKEPPRGKWMCDECKNK